MIIKQQIDMSFLKPYKLLFLTFTYLAFFSEAFSQSSRPAASFQLSVNSGCVPLTVSITNASLNATQYEWDFGNGSTSFVAQPSIIYSSAGVFTISLIAKDASGNSDTLTLQNAIQVNDIPLADFSYTADRVCLDQNQISFSNLSTRGQNYVWDFGDGNSSNSENPIYSYSDSGNYSVSLMVSDSLGCSAFKQSNQPIRIEKTPSLQFTVNDSIGCDTTQQFLFRCVTDSMVAWQWNFGDGNTSQVRNPAYTYSDTGKYTVRLITTNQFACIDTLEKINYITVNSKADLNFTSSVSSGCAPLGVYFYIDSAARSTSYYWKTGRGPMLNGDSVAATFDTSGVYPITLIANYTNGCTDSITKPNYIQVMGGEDVSFTTDTIPLCANGTIQFINTSQQASYRLFLWDFGDSTTSQLQNPDHVYSRAGAYQVTLSATDTNNCSTTYTSTITISTIQAHFTALNTRGCAPLTIDFVNNSSLSDRWFWNFGDGDTSHSKNPTHTFQTSGKFDISLVIETNSGCRDSIHLNEFIEVYDDTITAGLTDTIEGCLPMPIDFSNNNLGNTSWIWDFGNGDTSMIKSPTYTYQTPGTYTVSLSTFSSNGCPIFIKNYATFKINSIVPDMSVLLFDCSTRTLQLTDSTKNAASWIWNFGDRTFSTLQSPIHQFPDTLVYDIYLTIFTANGCSQNIFFPGFADFRNCLIGGQVPTVGTGGGPAPNRADTIRQSARFAQNCAPQIVQLANPKTNAFTWHWDFGDGDTSILEHPIHTYRTQGVFDVILVAEDSLGKDTITWANYITVNGPLADFNVNISYTCDSASVRFNNISQQADTWTWHFANVYDTITVSPQHKFPYSNNNHAVHLAIKDSMGCRSSKISILNFPPAGIIFNTPDSSCVGDSLSFIANDTSARYLWNFGDGSSDSSFHAFHVYSAPGIYPVQVISTSLMGCVTVHMLDSIVVKGISAEFDLLDSVNCAKNYFSFRPKDPTADSYLWKANRSIISSTQLANVKFAHAGNYQINLKVQKDGCQNTFTHPTTVEVKGVDADFTISQLNHCYPIQVHVADTNSKSVQWEWKIDSLTLNNINHHSFTVNNDSVNISLKVTAMNGCVDSTQKLFLPSTLTSNFDLSDTTGCLPLNVRFTNHAKHSVHSYWSFGDGDTSSATHPTHTYTSEGIYTVQLITRTINGCLDTTRHENAVRVSSVEANYNASFNSSCAPMMVTFNNTSIHATSWKWSFGDGTSSTAPQPMKIYNNSGSFDVMLIAANSHGCIDTMRVKNEIVVPGPITKFSMSDTSLCRFSPTQFTDSSVNAVQWTWLFGDGNTSNQQHPTYTYTTVGEYSVALTTVDSAGCSGFYTHPNSIKINQEVKANFQLSDSVGCTPFTIQLTADSSSASKWLWNFGEGLVTRNQSASHTFTQPGSYSISLLAENNAGCSDSTRFDSILVSSGSIAAIQAVAPICNNDSPIQLVSSEAGGIWTGLGIVNNTTGLYNPSKAEKGIDTVTYSFQGVCPSSDIVHIKIKEAPSIDFTVDKSEGCYELDVRFETLFKDSISSDLKPMFNWRQNGVSFANAPIATQKFNPGVFDIALEISLINGCKEKIIKSQAIQVFDSIPLITNMNKVSVLSDREVLVEWGKNIDPAFSHYTLYRKSNSSYAFSPILTISDPSQDFYIDTVSTTLDSTYCYKIVATDKCGLKGNLLKAPFHCTINITAHNLGKYTIKVQWNKYIGCSVDYYEILRFDNSRNSTGQCIARITSKQLEYIDTTAYCNYQYTYKIQAIGPRGLKTGSYSDTSTVKVVGIAHLQTSEIIRATVEEDNFVRIEWTPVTVAPEFFQGYVIHRSLDNINYTPLTFVPKETTAYSDLSTEVNKTRYFYQIEVVNTCENKIERTTTGSSILLRSTQIDDHSGKINWTNYEKWEEGIKHYEVQRLNEFNQWETFQLLPPTARELFINF